MVIVFLAGSVDLITVSSNIREEQGEHSLLWNKRDGGVDVSIISGPA